MIKAGYVVHGELKNTTEADAQKLDIINIAFATCREGVFCFNEEKDLSHLSRLRRANPNLRILFSVGGWGAGGFSAMASTEEGRKKFAASCLAALQKYRLDGIDIDWEYPGLDWAGIDASPADRENFTKMLYEVRHALDAEPGHRMLTIAVGCDNYYITHTEMDKIAPLLDYVSIMTYDMRGCGDTITGHHTNLFPTHRDLPRSYRSVQHSVNIYHEAGVPYHKIVIGFAMYSRMWKQVRSADNNGLWQESDPGDYGPSYGDIAQNSLNRNGFVRFWDSECQAPYLFNGDTLISYDDETSVRAKVAFAKDMGLAGLMYWEHSNDPSRVLLDAFYREAVKEIK